MSLVIRERIVDYVKLTLNKKDGSGTTNIWASREYFAANAIDSGGSSECWPILAASPVPKRGVGTVVGIRFDITLQFYGKTDLDEVGTSLWDLQDDHEFHNSKITIYKDAIPLLAAGTNTTTRATVRVVGLNWSENGILTLTTRPYVPVDREVVRRLESADYSSLDERFAGAYGGMCIGEGNSATETHNVLSAPFINKTGSSPTYHEIFTGWHNGADGHEYKFHQTLLCQVDPTEKNDAIWQHMERDLSPTTLSHGYAPGGSIEGNMAQYDFFVKVTTASGAQPVTHITTSIKEKGTVTDDIGTLSAVIYLCENDQIVGSALRRVPIPISSWTSGGFDDITVEMVTDSEELPFVMSFSNEYFIGLEWSNNTDNTNYPAIKLSGSHNNYFVRDRNVDREAGLLSLSSNGTPNLAVWCLSQAASGFWDQTTATNYSYWRLATNYDTDAVGKMLFKTGQKGLKDDGSGTYTGSADALIENPADVARFFLQDDEFGMDFPDSALDTTAFGNVRTNLSNDGITLNFSLEKKKKFTGPDGLIADILRNSRCIGYADRQNRASIHYPVPLLNNADIDSGGAHQNFDQVYMGESLQIISLKDNDYSTVINDAEFRYQTSEFKELGDPWILKRSKDDERLENVFKINPDASTNTDTQRQTLLTDSKTLYGLRQHRSDLYMLSTDTEVEQVAHYWVDRYHELHQRLVIRVPWRDYYNVLDLFSNVRVNHTKLPNESGTHEFLRAHNDGTPVVTYYQGVPMIDWRGGTIAGEVITTWEIDEWLYVEVETMSSFYADQ